MTTIAMIAGMMPAALGLDSGGAFRAPMSIAVIGGLLSSTVLSLVFVPAVFAVMDDIGRLAWRVFSRFVGRGRSSTRPAHQQCRKRAAAGSLRRRNERRGVGTGRFLPYSGKPAIRRPSMKASRAVSSM
jgi:hypothetical protein